MIAPILKSIIFVSLPAFAWAAEGQKRGFLDSKVTPSITRDSQLLALPQAVSLARVLRKLETSDPKVSPLCARL